MKAAGEARPARTVTLDVTILGREFKVACKDDEREELTEAVTLARRAGLSWAQIGDAAGISADHAARRWGSGGVRGEHPPTNRRADRSPRPDTVHVSVPSVSSTRNATFRSSSR